MPYYEAIAPAAAVVAAFVLLAQVATPRTAWARWTIFLFALAVMFRYVPWRLTETVMPSDPLTVAGAWIWFLFVVECVFILDLLKILLVRCRFQDRKPEADAYQRRLEARDLASWPSVDVFIPTYNEPLDVLERSIIGALNLDYPAFTVHVLDDGDRDWLRDFCAEHGANYITRAEHKHAKAGNINNALPLTDGELIAMFDADFVPYRWFLKRTVGFFEDETIGIVQTPQHFFNRDPVQRNLWIADRWPDEQRLFFDHLAPSLDAWDSMFFCGSCSVLRRKAVDDIGGLPTASITEDILTTLEMFRAGYHTRYLNEKLSIGLAAESLEAFYVQRQRWCQGNIQTLFLRDGPLLGAGMSLVQRVLLFPIYWVFQIPARLLVLFIPIVYLWTGLEPLQNANSLELLYWQIPVVAVGWATGLYYFGRNGMPVLNDGAAILVSMRLTPTVLSSLVRPFGKPFRVTPKGSMAGGSRVAIVEVISIAVLIALNLGGIWVNIPSDYRIVDSDEFLGIAVFWTAFNVAALTVALFACFESPARRLQERFPVATLALLRGEDGSQSSVIVEDISLTGASMTCIRENCVAKGDIAYFDIPDAGTYRGRIMRAAGGGVGIDFDPEPAGEDRSRLIRLLYTSGIDNAAHVGDTFSLLRGLANRLWGERRGT